MLKEAATLYKHKNGLVPAGTVLPAYEKLGPRFQERDFQIGEGGNTYDMLIRKQHPGTCFPSPIAYIYRRDTISPLGTADCHFYYVIFRKKVLNSWADTLENKKWVNKPGIYLPIKILDHIEKNDVRGQSTIVLTLEDGRTFGAPAMAAFGFIKKLRIFLFINAFGQICTALPLEIFHEDQ